jgi:hypothetical protein
MVQTRSEDRGIYADHVGTTVVTKTTVSICRMTSQSPHKKSMREMWIKPGDGLCYQWQAFGAFKQKHSNPRSLQRVANCWKMCPSPLLNELCKEDRRQTAYWTFVALWLG